MKKILLIGDSIRIGYDKYVKMAFDGVAEVYYPNENCRFAAYVVRHLHDWKCALGIPDDLDLIHVNVGLWDDLVLLDGEHLTPLPIYEYYVDRMFKMIKRFFPVAKIIFATSTPVREALFTSNKRYNADTRAYNDAAVKIAERYGAYINDLYEITEKVPKSYYSDHCHLYTKDGTRLHTEKVVSEIENVLGIKGKTLNFDELFVNQKDVLGT